MMTLTRCTAKVPEALSGDLRPLPQCTLTSPNGHHTGDHRASRLMPGVGKITYRWKQRQRAHRPEIVLPLTPDTRLTSKMQRKCACPDWWTGHGHTRPCTL